MRYGGKKCLLTAKEVQEITAGKVIKRQDYYLTKDMPKWIPTKLITIAAEIIKAILF